MKDAPDPMPRMQFTEEEKEAIRRWRPVYHAALREMVPIQAHVWNAYWEALDQGDELLGGGPGLSTEKVHAISQVPSRRATRLSSAVIEAAQAALSRTIGKCAHFLRESLDGLMEQTFPVQLMPTTAMSQNDMAGSSILLYEAESPEAIDFLHLKGSFRSLTIEARLVSGEPALRARLDPVEALTGSRSAVEIEVQIRDAEGRQIWTARPLALTPGEVNDTGFVRSRFPTDPERVIATITVEARIRGEDEDE